MAAGIFCPFRIIESTEHKTGLKPNRMQSPIAVVLTGVLFAAILARAQEPAPAGAVRESAPRENAGKPESASNGKKGKVPPYVVLGTIFNENALSYPNVRVQVRRAGEKKFRWETYTNSRGEFALRVPEGQEYELVVHEKSYKDVSLKLSADNGVIEQRLSIRLEKKNREKDNSKQ